LRVKTYLGVRKKEGKRGGNCGVPGVKGVAGFRLKELKMQPSSGPVVPVRGRGKESTVYTGVRRSGRELKARLTQRKVGVERTRNRAVTRKGGRKRPC